MGPRKFEEYKGRRFYTGDYALVVDVWMHRVDEDVSGLTFEEWDPSVDTDSSQTPVTMIVHSVFRAPNRRLRSQTSDTTTTRGGGTWRPASARGDPQADSRYGYQDLCTLRG